MGDMEDEPPKVNGENEEEFKSQLKTAPHDPRFPNDNVSYYCFQMYKDLHRCLQLFDAAETCNYFQTVVKSICPNEWVTRWDELREIGTFPGLLPSDKKKK